jgi:hypothetical protein
MSREQIAEKCWDHVNSFFESTIKSEIWFETKNPLLGGVSPNDMIDAGREEKLLKFIEYSMDENVRSVCIKRKEERDAV